ncbi:iron reductase [uncultured Mycolicibacterium sp.]|uniref:iron reductase n=1 Tax=uncultured Mycolicibacterium sp. TaxID=2320817 RepID=UPI00262B7D8B|nr:iron reductase [uncultured Mycolicibacterium sp.]
MTVVIDDPLITGMAIRRRLPLHDSAQRLRELCPEAPRVYGVAVMADVYRRRWWPLREALTADRLRTMYEAAVAETGNPAAVAQQLAATLAHAVVGRVVPLLALEGRAWDTGLENLWVHVDSEGAVDWVGVEDPVVRALPDDPCVAGRRHGVVNAARDGIVTLPSEAALATWVAHRSHRTLAPLFARLERLCGGAMSTASMWHLVGTTVVGAVTQVTLLAGTGELVGMRRGQAVLDAFVAFGLPVRGTTRPAARVLLN